MEDSDDLQENGFGRMLEVKGGWSGLENMKRGTRKFKNNAKGRSFATKDFKVSRALRGGLIH